MTFAAYRYILASIVLLTLMLTRYKDNISFKLKQLIIFLAPGFTGYYVAQGLQFIGLYYLPAVTVTFILNMTPIIVLVLSTLFLKERPTTTHFAGIIVTIFGVMIFFASSLLAINEVIGVLLTAISGIGWASYMVISRYYLRDSKIDVLALTSYPMFFGALLLFGTAILSNNVMLPSIRGWTIILWLSMINTALAFILWNHAPKN